tara:strand:+ start:472 stop:873 length:402 start_codon:yes stop_codon:yes gene_type:complete
MLSMEKPASSKIVMHNARSALDADLHVGRKVRKARKAMEMSQTELGDQLGVSFQQIQKYEKGSNRIGSGRLWEMSRVLQVPIDYFFDGIDESVSSEKTVPWWLLNLAKQIESIKDEKLQKQIISLIEACSEKD